MGKGTVDLDDITDYADLIVIVGQNPGTNHPRMLTALEHAKKRGARIISANPLPEAGLIRFKNPQTPKGLIGGGTKLSDRHLAVRVNGDIAMFAGVNKVLLAREEAAPGTVFDHEFIDTYCDGFDEVCDAWRALDWSTIEYSERTHESGDRGICRRRHCRQERHRLLGHGSHAAPQFGRHDP